MKFNPKAAFQMVLALSFVVLAGLFGRLLLGTAEQANATPQLFYLVPQALATTSSAFSYLKPGTAFATSSSPILDSQVAGPGRRLNAASLAIQLTASSSPNTVLKWRYEYSPGLINTDCKVTPLACDWYSESQELTTLATTTVVVSNTKEYLWTFASTSVGLSSTWGDRATKIVTVPTLTRYIRAIFYTAAGSAQAAVTSQWIASGDNS